MVQRQLVRRCTRQPIQQMVLGALILLGRIGLPVVTAETAAEDSGVQHAASSDLSKGGAKCDREKIASNLHWLAEQKCNGDWSCVEADDIEAHTRAWKAFVKQIPDYETSVGASTFGRGIVYCAGQEGLHRLYASIQMLRVAGSQLPIELWHFENELSTEGKSWLESLGVSVRDISDTNNFVTIEGSAELYAAAGALDIIKPAAIINSAFEEVIFLDNDNIPVADPASLFELEGYKTAGALFWSDYWKTDPLNPVYTAFEVACEDEREFDSGQMVINKPKSWTALNLAWHINLNYNFYGRLLYGGKDSFRFAWKATGSSYELSPFNPVPIGFMLQDNETPDLHYFCGHTMGQFGPNQDLLFLHSNLVKHGIYQHLHNGFDMTRLWDAAQIVLDPAMDEIVTQVFSSEHFSCARHLNKTTGHTLDVQPVSALLSDEFFHRFAAIGGPDLLSTQ